MVLGRGGKELRLNPISNIDIDPNSISAKVFLKETKNSRDMFRFLKELFFHIEIPSIDLGKVYFGEELNINIENFLSLPAKCSLWLEWNMERPGGRKEDLTSNVKMSASRRTIVIKELKEDQLGIISCTLYSSNGVALAKRRFSIKKIEHTSRRRSLRTRHNGIRRQSLVCGFPKIAKSVSRKKRFRKLFSRSAKMFPRMRMCGYRQARKRLHPRWISFESAIPALEPRLLSIEKLVELSEDSDGTLDDVIPHEIHFIEPRVALVTDNVFESVRSANSKPDCSRDSECSEGAFCLIPRTQTRPNYEKRSQGYCYCLPEYFGDGSSCRKIPLEGHRDKRIRKRQSNVWPLVHSLFYSASTSFPHRAPVTEIGELYRDTNQKRKLGLLYEEEESYLLSSCLDRRDCSQHAICRSNGRNRPSCKCLSGFRGNGIFCLETVDYIPEEVFDYDASES